MADLASVRMQAEAGDAKAQAMLADALLRGRVVRPDPQEALRWVEASCAQGFAEAHLLRATMAALGLGRPQNLHDAFDQLARAAALGHAYAQSQLAALTGASGFNLEAWRTPPRAVQHFDAPRIFTIETFIPAEACAWIVAQSSKAQRAAPVLDRNAKSAAINAVRTNTSCYFDRLGHELILHLVDLRIAALSGLHVIHQEPTNVLRYQPGQEYKPHYDFFAGADEAAFGAEIARIGQRIGTVLIYLNDDYAGGETAFPHLDWRCKGKTGDALLFWSANAQGQLERNALHAGLPVTAGEKWLLSKWLRAKPVPFNWVQSG